MAGLVRLDRSPLTDTFAGFSTSADRFTMQQRQRRAHSMSSNLACHSAELAGTLSPRNGRLHLQATLHDATRNPTCVCRFLALVSDHPKACFTKITLDTNNTICNKPDSAEHTGDGTSEIWLLLHPFSLSDCRSTSLWYGWADVELGMHAWGGNCIGRRSGVSGDTAVGRVGMQ